MKSKTKLICSIKILTVIISMVILSSSIFITTVTAAGNFESGSNLFDQSINPADLPASASYTAFGTSSSFTSAPQKSSPGENSPTPEIITENRLSLLKGQSATHMVIFKNEGVLTARVLAGSGFELFSKKGGSFPDNVTFRTDYGKSSLVTESGPVMMNITPGTWFFTLLPLGDESSYDLKAEELVTSSGSSSDVGLGSFSSSMGAASFSLG